MDQSGNERVLADPGQSQPEAEQWVDAGTTQTTGANDSAVSTVEAVASHGRTESSRGQVKPIWGQGKLYESQLRCSVAQKISNRKILRNATAKKPAQLEINERFLLHMRTTRKLMGLLQRCQKLHESGKTAQARRLFRECEKLNEKLLELKDIGPRLH